MSPVFFLFSILFIKLQRRVSRLKLSKFGTNKKVSCNYLLQKSRYQCHRCVLVGAHWHCSFGDIRGRTNVYDCHQPALNSLNMCSSTTIHLKNSTYSTIRCANSLCADASKRFNPNQCCNGVPSALRAATASKHKVLLSDVEEA